MLGQGAEGSKKRAYLSENRYNENTAFQLSGIAKDMLKKGYEFAGRSIN